jgi:hypothetical protein
MSGRLEKRPPELHEGFSVWAVSTELLPWYLAREKWMQKNKLVCLHASCNLLGTNIRSHGEELSITFADPCGFRARTPPFRACICHGAKAEPGYYLFCHLLALCSFRQPDWLRVVLVSDAAFLHAVNRS